MFDVRRSFLINPSYETSQGQSFFFDQTGRLRPEAALNVEPRTQNPSTLNPEPLNPER